MASWPPARVLVHAPAVPSPIRHTNNALKEQTVHMKELSCCLGLEHMLLLTSLTEIWRGVSHISVIDVVAYVQVRGSSLVLSYVLFVCTHTHVQTYVLACAH